MSDKEIKKEAGKMENQNEELTGQPGNAPEDAGQCGGEDQQEEQNLIKELEKLQLEKEDLVNTARRLQAEFENFRRRTRTEKEELVKYAVEGLVAKLLPVVDNFERALQAVEDKAELRSFAEGVEMIFRQFMQVLEQEGLTPVEAVGCQFDPNCHEAVMQVESEDHESNTVLEEFQKGYHLNGRLIRPSMVKVTK